MKKTFKKEERLCSKLLINKLFHNGSSFIVYPFRVVYLPIDSQLPQGVQALLSVPKRKFKRAHQRNRIKRKMKEAYRLQKSEYLYPHIQLRPNSLILAIQYIASDDLPFDQLCSNMRKTLNKIAHETA